MPYFTPIQDPPAGKHLDEQPEGSLFCPLKINGLTIHNRIIVSPMCQYVILPPKVDVYVCGFLIDSFT